jgi:hypothetical protein
MDCFASLAMTISQLVLKNVDARDKPGHDAFSIDPMIKRA